MGERSKRPEDNRYYNPNNPDHQQIVEVVENYMQRNKRADESDIAADILPILEEHDIELSEGSVRNILSEAREDLEAEDKIRVTEDPRGGNPATVYISKMHEE